MDDKNNLNLEEKLQELEKEINGSNPSEVKPESTPSLSNYSDRSISWFKALPKGGQIAVVIVAAVAGLTLIKILMELISLSIGLGFMALLLYFAYKFFLGENPSNHNQE